MFLSVCCCVPFVRTKDLGPYKLKGQCDQISYKEQDYCNMGNNLLLHKDQNIMLVSQSKVVITMSYKYI